MMKFVVVAALAGMAAAECPNGCSGHGTCGLYDACTCYRNWQANDCSERVCPFGKAFVDSPLGDMDGDGDVQGTNDGQAATGSATDGGIVWTKYTNTNNNHNEDDENTGGYDADFASLVPSCSSSAAGASDACKAGLAVYERWPYKGTDYGGDQTLTASDGTGDADEQRAYGTKDPTDGVYTLVTATIETAKYQEGHFYRECSNKGVCDRKSGECDCFDGYTGSACQRTTCPNDCSGHGTCEYMRELADGKRIAAPDAPSPTLGNRMMACTTLIADTDGDGDMDIVRNDGTCGWIEGDADDNHGTQYSLWDEESQMGCRCDAGFSGPDCSSKKCPLGDDPLTRGAQVEGAVGSTAIGFHIHGGAAVTGPALDNVGPDGTTAVTAAGARGNIGFAGIELADSDVKDINDKADADFMVLLGRGLKAGDWINIREGTGANAYTYCRIKSLDDTNDPYITAAATSGLRSGQNPPQRGGSATQTQVLTHTQGTTERHFDGNDDGKIDQIVCHASAEYPQLIQSDQTTSGDGLNGVAAWIDARQVDEVQEIIIKVGTAAKVYYTSLVTGKEYEVGVISAAAIPVSDPAHTDDGKCDISGSTSNGVVENMFEAIPNAVVPGLIVTLARADAGMHDASTHACKYSVTFTHNPGALHPIRVETHVLSTSSGGELEGTQYVTRQLVDGTGDATPEAATFDALHVTADGVGDTLDITTEHYYKMTFAATNSLAKLPAGSRLRIEGTQWNDGWFTVGHIQPTTTVVYVIEPVVEEDATKSAVWLHVPTITAFTQKKVVGTKEALPCSGRGLCDGSTGTCECFRGSTGLACDQQTALEA